MSVQSSENSTNLVALATGETFNLISDFRDGGGRVGRDGLPRGQRRLAARVRRGHDEQPRSQLSGQQKVGLERIFHRQMSLDSLNAFYSSSLPVILRINQLLSALD